MSSYDEYKNRVRKTYVNICKKVLTLSRLTDMTKPHKKRAVCHHKRPFSIRFTRKCLVFYNFYSLGLVTLFQLNKVNAIWLIVKSYNVFAVR